MPDFLTASIVAKFDCKLFNALMASLYVRRFIGAGVVGDEALGALIYRGNKGGTRDTRVSGRENRVGVGVEQRQVVAGLEGVHIRHNQSGGSRGQRTAGCVCKGSGTRGDDCAIFCCFPFAPSPRVPSLPLFPTSCLLLNPLPRPVSGSLIPPRPRPAPPSRQQQRAKIFQRRVLRPGQHKERGAGYTGAKPRRSAEKG